MAENGNNIIVYASNDNGTSWTAVAATKSDELQTECELIEKASAAQQAWREYIPGRKSWGLNVAQLVTAVADIRNVLQIGTRVKIRVGGRTYSGSAGVEGFAIVRQCKVSMTRGALANGSFIFQGDGPLE
jgi:predicted secreted protein